MSYELIYALAVFAFVSSITPGPNNLMLMASGANFGFWRTMPHMLGVALGFGIMVVLVGAGLVGLFEAFPISHTILKVMSVAYLLFLAWKIATAAGPVEAGADADAKSGTPMTFVQAALFQWVNPKAWTMALTAVTVYAPNNHFISILMVAMIFTIINFPSVGSWTVLGQIMRQFLTNPRRLMIFNIVMAVLLVGSLYPVLF